MPDEERQGERKLTPFRLPEGITSALRERATAEGRSQNRIAEDALRVYLGRSSPALPVPAPIPQIGAVSAPVEVSTIPPITRPVDLGTFRWGFEANADALLSAGKHVLLLGGHGLGKSLFARRWAVEHSRPVWIVTASAGVERDTLEGQYLPTVNGHGVSIRAVDGILTSAIREGGLLMLEEGTGMMPDIQLRFLSALNSHVGEFDVSYRGAAVPVHPEFVCIMTGNPPGKNYRGTDRLNSALLSRFAVVEIPFPTLEETLAYLSAIGSPEELREPLARLAVQVWQTFDKGQVNNYVSPRELSLYLGALRSRVPDDIAFRSCILNKFDATQRPAILHTWGMLRPSLENPSA